MEERIITFTANEQGLVKTGGISHYASDTISYIKAVFTLGENWQGFDEVRAVFKSPYECRPAVLDSNGECYVPVEVLFYKGKVRVNLVGSIVTETEITDRLTTYSVEALDVDEDVPICGEESQPISPSEYEQFVAKVANDANRASQSATDAETYADEAEASAQNASESASASAVSASDSARSATASAGYAQDASEIAVEVEVMKNEVELAKDKVLGMRATAETLEAGSDATASYSDGLLTLGIPRGDQGIQGIQGETGATPNLTIGTVETLEPTEDATATITGTAENPVLNLGLPKGDTGEVSLEDLGALLPTDTASGDIASITDGQNVVPVKSLKVTLEPIQDLHGYDKPWAGGAGANVAEPISGNVNGLTFTPQDDGTVKITGTVQVATWTWLPTDMFELPYKGVSAGDSVVLYSDTQILLRTYDENGTLLQSVGASNEDWKTVIIDANATKIIFYFYAKAATPQAGEVISTIAHFYVAKGSTFTAWTPYSNICPISGHTKCVTYVSPTTSETDAETYTTTLGRTVYGGTLDVVSGVLTVDRAMVDLGTLSWALYDGIFYANVNGKAYLNTNADMICDSYPVYATNAVNVNDAKTKLSDGEMCGFRRSSSQGTASYVYIKDANYSTTAELATALNGKMLCYELATPQTYQLTPQEIKLLLGTNNVWSDGNVTLVYSADIQRWVEKKLNGNSTTLTMSRPMTAELNETETE